MLLRGSGDDTEVLLQLRGSGASYMADHWACGAAGHLEYGEPVTVAAAREAKEELGIDVDPGDVDPLCTLLRTEHGNDDPIEQRVDFFATLRRWGGDPSIQEPTKCRELRWCRLSSAVSLPHPIVPHEEHVLRGLASGRVAPFTSLGFIPGAGS